MILAITLLVFFTAILTAAATFNFIILHQEIETTGTGYNVTILNNTFYYE